MKKFMKVSAIIAVALIVVGLVVGGVAARIQGPRNISDVVESVTGGKIHVNLGDVISDSLSNLDSGVRFDIGADIKDRMDFVSGYEILSGEVHEDFSGEVKSLEIDAGACEIRFEKSRDADFHLDGHKIGKMQCFVKNGTLTIKAIRTTKIVDKDACEIVLYVPEGVRFAMAEVKLGAGSLEVGNLTAGSIEIELGAGEVVCTGLLQADKMELEIGMGSVSAEKVEVDTLEAEVGMGSLTVNSAAIRRKAELECSMGNIEMKLAGSEKDYNFELGSAMGETEIDGVSVSGLSGQRRIDNDADREIAVECSMGSVRLSFEE